MTKKKAFQEIEQMFRSYRLWQLRLAAMQPRLVSASGCAFIPRKGAAPRRPTENLAIQRTDVAAWIERERGKPLERHDEAADESIRIRRDEVTAEWRRANSR